MEKGATLNNECKATSPKTRFGETLSPLRNIFAIFVGLIDSVMKEKRAYTLPECTVIAVMQKKMICVSGDPQQTGNRSDYSYGGNWGMIGSDD